MTRSFRELGEGFAQEEVVTGTLGIGTASEFFLLVVAFDVFEFKVFDSAQRPVGVDVVFGG